MRDSYETDGDRYDPHKKRSGVSIDLLKLEHWLTKLGISQKYLATLTGISSRTIERIYKSGVSSISNHAKILESIELMALERGRRMGRRDSEIEVPDTFALPMPKLLDDQVEDSGDGNGGGLSVKQLTCLFELIWPNEKPSTYPPERLQAVLKEIHGRIRNEGPPIEVANIKEGSLKVTLALTPQEAKQLQSLIQSGQFSDDGIASGKVVSDLEMDIADIENMGVGNVSKPAPAKSRRSRQPEFSLNDKLKIQQIRKKARQKFSEVLLQEEDPLRYAAHPIVRLRSTHRRDRATALSELTAMGASAESALWPIAETIVWASDPLLRAAAFRALIAIGPPSAEAFALLVALENPEISIFAAQAVGEMSSDAPELQQMLIAMVQHNQWIIRRFALETIGKTNQITPTSLHVIAKCLVDEELNVRVRANRLIKSRQIPKVHVLSEFVRICTTDPTFLRRFNAAIEDPHRFDQACQIVRMLNYASKHTSPEESRASTILLGAVLGPFLRLLLHKLFSVYEYECNLSEELIRRLGLVPQLLWMLREKAMPSKYYAAEAVVLLGKKASAAVPALIEMLLSDDPCLQEIAAVALEAVGSNAAGAIPRLQELASVSDQDVAKAATNALKSITHNINKDK